MVPADGVSSTRHRKTVATEDIEEEEIGGGEGNKGNTGPSGPTNRSWENPRDYIDALIDSEKKWVNSVFKILGEGVSKVAEGMEDDNLVRMVQYAPKAKRAAKQATPIPKVASDTSRLKPWQIPTQAEKGKNKNKAVKVGKRRLREVIDSLELARGTKASLLPDNNKLKRNLEAINDTFEKRLEGQRFNHEMKEFIEDMGLDPITLQRLPDTQDPVVEDTLQAEGIEVDVADGGVRGGVEAPVVEGGAAGHYTKIAKLPPSIFEICHGLKPWVSYKRIGRVLGGLGSRWVFEFNMLGQEAYKEFKHVLLALIYGKDDQTSPVANEWVIIRRFEIAGLLSSVLRAYLIAYDPIFSMTLRYLISIHKGFCLRQGISSPISDLTERLLLEECDPPQVPQEILYEAPPFDEVDTQALAHAVEIKRQGVVDSLRFSKGNLFQAFQIAVKHSGAKIITNKEDDKYEFSLEIMELASKEMASEVVEEVDATDPKFLKLVKCGDHSGSLRIACFYLGPLAASNPILLKFLKETLLVLLKPNGDTPDNGIPFSVLASSLQVAMGRRLGVDELLLMKLMRATLHTHNEWFRLQMCKDRFEALLKIDSLKEIKTPLIIDDVSKKSTDNFTPRSSQMTRSSSNRMVEDGYSPTQVSSGDVIYDKTAILKVI
ncbi:hypothetical protein GIB67_007950, partial [Kingdonia uniflora]